MMNKMKKYKKNLVGTHWGNYYVETNNNIVTNIEPFCYDSNPSAIGKSLFNITDAKYRISQPMIREGYLRGDSNHRQNRGKEPFVPVCWDEALDVAAYSLKSAISKNGNSGIYGGSYGWGSAGRFHHAQSQVHRFLNIIGGYTKSVNTYSHAAAEVIIPHVLGIDLTTAGNQLVMYDEISENCDLCIAFGGLGNYNLQVLSGGVGNHLDKEALEQFARRNIEVISISPMVSDTTSIVKFEWLKARPCTDTAIMLGIAHFLEVTGKTDDDFIKRCTIGYNVFKDYLLGRTDGVVKDLHWASQIADVKQNDIKRIAEKLAKARCPLITVSASLQRAEHGEQPYWMAVTLAAMLGSFGKAGGGVGLKWGSNGNGIYNKVPFRWGRLPQGQNPISEMIPVARITDMLLNPGKSYLYNGQLKTYPDINLIYWAGGNPFHHHQDLNRLRRAWEKPDTVIVNESVWTATARHADIVFPVNTFLERNDIVCGRDLFITPSKKVLDNYANSRSDYEVFCGLSDRLGVLKSFTKGLDEMGWLESIYQESKNNAKQVGIDLPTFEEFWEAGVPINLKSQVPGQKSLIKSFVSHPEKYPLPTPSGKIEIFSSNIDSYNYKDCVGYPRWYEKKEWLGAAKVKRFPLHLISPQPRNKLHSQLDFGTVSLKDKTKGRETVTLNPIDAEERGITENMTVRIFNDRGACLAGVRISNDIMQGVISLPTGAWYCTDETLGDVNDLEHHGNPNVLTEDAGSSSLSQGPIAHSCLVEVELFKESAKSVYELLSPKFAQRINKNKIFNKGYYSGE